MKRAGLAPSPPRSSFGMAHWKQAAFLFGGVTDRHGTKDAMYSELHNELYQFNLASCRWFPVSMRQPKGQVGCFQGCCMGHHSGSSRSEAAASCGGLHLMAMLLM